VAVPLVGVGFSVSLTSRFRIPNFIMDFIRARPLLYAGYIALLIVLLIMGIRWLFCLHAVLVDDMKPAEAKKASVKIMKEHWKEFIPLMLGVIVILFLINLAFGLLLKLPEAGLESAGVSLPHHYYVDFKSFTDKTATDLDYQMAGYRFISTFVVIAGAFLMYILAMISSSYLLLRFTRCYWEYTREPSELWPERVKKSRYFTKVLVVIASLVGLLVLSFFIGLKFNQVVGRDEPVKIIAHRAGGVMAPENSLEGVEAAIFHKCYGTETDTHRTSDGYYIINHDSDFSRLCGVAKKPEELTLEEVKKLTITDPATGKTAPVPTVEEMLDVSKGRIKLFLELKGESADKQMAEDLVKMIREKDCVGDVVLISLDGNLIEYIETTYPEFETGILMFAGIGDVSRLKCDLLIMEEDMGTEERILLIHESGKQAIVWTVNTEDSMHRFFDSSCDAVITDQVELAEKVQAEMDQRSDFQIIRDKFSNIFDD
jgi:glycerophosphoryl diester phosphodiesterase